jgi:hypothetical protein
VPQLTWLQNPVGLSLDEHWPAPVQRLVHMVDLERGPLVAVRFDQRPAGRAEGP